jgi:gamma-glutamyltranspeptidase/glutathione hydrolase
MNIPSALAAIGIAGVLTVGVIGQQDAPAPGGRTAAPLVTVGRSKIATQYGIVAASQPLAARAGVQVLERGGNAVDAAIATNAVMALVEPYFDGIGGDLFVIYYEAKTGTLPG